MAEGFEELDLKSWKDFKSSIFDKIAKTQATALGATTTPTIDPKRFIFRGQGCRLWGLETSFDRRYVAKMAGDTFDIDAKYEEKMEKFLLDCEYYGVDEDTKNGLREDRRRFLEEKAQHYGMPTRLLDWTVSPYVAAFFAFSDERYCNSRKVSIWAMDFVEAKRCFRNSEVDILKSPLSNNARMRMQQGLFTLNRSNLSKLEDLFRATNKRAKAPFQYPVLYKFNISVTESSEAMADLERMGIDYTRLFPGIEGVCKQIEYDIWKDTK